MKIVTASKYRAKVKDIKINCKIKRLLLVKEAKETYMSVLEG